MTHFKKVCKKCEKVIVQCRCFKDKTVVFDICDECKKDAEEKEES